MRTELRKETSKSAVSARVKTLLSANLGWLEGFPLDVAGGVVRWMSVPAAAPAREMPLEGQHLSRATYALNKLRGELAPALALLSDEPEAWLDSVESRLERLKGAVHRGDRLSQRFFQDALFPARFRDEASRLIADEPRLKPFLNALAWVHAGKAWDALKPAREWGPGFLALASRLGEVPALVTFLHLAQLAMAHGQERVQPLAACLLDERSHHVALEEGPKVCTLIAQGLGRRGKTPLPDALPEGSSLGSELVRWCEELVQQNRRTQQKLLRLFELATPLPLVERWADWWDTTRRLLRDAHRLRAQPYDRDSRQSLRTGVERHQKSAPPAFNAEDLMETLRLHRAAAAESTDPLLRVLALVPAGAVAPGRIHFAVYWTFIGYSNGTPASRIATLLAGFERYLRRLGQLSQRDAARLKPWTVITAEPASYCNTVDQEMLHEMQVERRPRHAVLAAYEHLAATVARYGGLPPEAAAKAVELFFLAPDPGLAAAAFDSLHAAGNFRLYLPPALTRLALRLCQESPRAFAGVLKELIAWEDRDELQFGDWPEPILGPLCTGAVGELVREAIGARQLDRLIACGTKSMLLQAARVEALPLPSPGETAEPGWIERYPTELHPAICRLAAVLGDEAEIRVARWLAADLPDAGRLEREIQAIGLRLPGADSSRQPALRTRLANLQERLARPAFLSPSRLERLRARLDRAWGRAVFDRWESGLDARLPEALRRLLGIEDVPPWLTGILPLSLLAAATRLPERHRQLACRLFRLRCGPPSWDLRDAPQNRGFVNSLPHLDWSPWIDGVGTLSVEAAGGRTLHLALEDDPLEIFRMGAHFQTCLSPGAMNYFSVFANAADINKRVLYARDGEGKVVGRCLLALTTKGELLVFEPYCHDGNLGFKEICDDFADLLARRVGTVRAPRGKVQTLVATDWYDDGPLDLVRSYPALEEGSSLRRRLATLHPDKLAGELRRALKPALLDETTLPLVLALPEIQERPELAVPLVRPVAECRALPEGALVTAAHLATQAGAADLVRRLLLRSLIEHMRRGYQDYGRSDYRAINLLLRFDPARLLALLRQTRDKSVRDWLQETGGDRLEDAALALEALHRPRQAQSLWRRVATSNEVHASDELRQRAWRAIERLEKKAS